MRFKRGATHSSYIVSGSLRIRNLLLSLSPQEPNDNELLPTISGQGGQARTTSTITFLQINTLRDPNARLAHGSNSWFFHLTGGSFSSSEVPCF